MSAKRYVVPAVVSAALVLGAFYLGERFGGAGYSVEAKRESVTEAVTFPHGRTVYLIVDRDGVYVGKEYSPIILLDRFLEHTVRPLDADYAMVIGTNDAKYGDVVTVFDALRAHFSFPENIETRPVAAGTRREAIEEHVASFGRSES
jgi:hypothetical protein